MAANKEGKNCFELCHKMRANCMRRELEKHLDNPTVYRMYVAMRHSICSGRGAKAFVEDLNFFEKMDLQ